MLKKSRNTQVDVRDWVVWFLGRDHYSFSGDITNTSQPQRSTSHTLVTPGSLHWQPWSLKKVWVESRRKEVCGCRVGGIFPSHARLVPSLLCKTLPPHGEILVCPGLVNSTSLTLIIESCLHHEGLWAPGRWMNMVNTGTFAEWPLMQHWHIL